MEDSSKQSISYPGNLEKVSQDKRACTLITCYVIGYQGEYMSQLTDNDIKRIRSILGCGWQATAEEKSKDALSIIYSSNKAECINLVESLCKEFRASFDLQASNPSGSGHQSEVMRAERSNFTACEMVLDSLRK